MKQGMTLTALAAELERQSAAKRDFIADTRNLRVADDLRLTVADNVFPMTKYALGQVTDEAGIPRKFAERLNAPEFSDLLAYNINTLWSRDPKARLVRTLDGRARAFLSNRFNLGLDNDTIAEAVLPVLFDYPDMEIVSANITETRMYLKAVFPRIQGEVKVGDVVQLGIAISNSEIGGGAYSVAPMIYTLACLNGAIRDYGATRRVHIGAKIGADVPRELLRDDTVTANNRAFVMTLQDTTRAMISQDGFAALLADLQDATKDRIEKPIGDVVELTAKRFSLIGEEKDGLLKHLAMGGDFTRYGLHNAVTRLSQDVADYDRASELERIGGKVIELPRTDWAELALAA